MSAILKVTTALLAGIFPLNANNKESDTLVILAGSETALAGFEEAAKKCKLNGVSRIPAKDGKGTWVRVAGSPSLIGSGNKSLDCAMQYIMAHMGGDDSLGFIGNAAR